MSRSHAQTLYVENLSGGPDNLSGYGSALVTFPVGETVIPLTPDGLAIYNSCGWVMLQAPSGVLDSSHDYVMTIDNGGVALIDQLDNGQVSKNQWWDESPYFLGGLGLGFTLYGFGWVYRLVRGTGNVAP